MICGFTYYEILLYFMIYSVLGWMTEVAYHGVTRGKVVNRGFLNGPVCPVYGFGVLAVFMGLDLFSKAHQIETLNGFGIFFAGAVICSSIEFLAGWGLDMLFHARWWDYRDCPFNLNGYICLKFSILWGLGTVFVVRIVQRTVKLLAFSLVSPENGRWILLGCYVLFAADLVLTVSMIAGLNKKLKELDELQKKMRILSDRMSETIGTGAIHTAQSIEHSQVQASLARTQILETVGEKKAQIDAGREEFIRQRHDEAQQHIAQVQKQIDEIRNDVLSGKSPAVRLLNAFPSMRHERYENALAYLKENVKNLKSGNH